MSRPLLTRVTDWDFSRATDEEVQSAFKWAAATLDAMEFGRSPERLEQVARKSAAARELLRRRQARGGPR